MLLVQTWYCWRFYSQRRQWHNRSRKKERKRPNTHKQTARRQQARSKRGWLLLPVLCCWWKEDREKREKRIAWLIRFPSIEIHSFWNERAYSARETQNERGREKRFGTNSDPTYFQERERTRTRGKREQTGNSNKKRERKLNKRRERARCSSLDEHRASWRVEGRWRRRYPYCSPYHQHSS